MSKLTVYRASAGSGKTYRLAVEYVKMLIENPLSYKNILAVTFTNKATAEMKERILFKLYDIAQGVSDGFFATVKDETKLSPEQIIQRANRALSNILHDYSMFSISTIDSFVQRVIQNLLWEIGFHSNNEIKLDKTIYIEKAVDRLLDRSGEDKALFQHFKRMILSQLDEDNSPDIRASLVKNGEQLYSEKFRLLTVDEQAQLNNTELISSIEKYIDTVIELFQTQLNTLGKEAVDKLNSAGFSIADFSNGKDGCMGAFIKSIDLNKGADVEKIFLKRAQKALDSPTDGWLTKDVLKSSKGAELQELITSFLYPKLREIHQFISNKSPEYFTALVVSQNIDALRVFNDIRQSVKEILTEEGSMLLADSGPLLREFVGSNDAPFVYEKIGTRYEHFMLDEFQDTSEIQWSNFKPLIANGLAQDKYSLVVGDVKQAIYRWRNSDWRIFASGIENDFDVVRMNLDTNFRSLPQIVSFNNSIFEGISKFLPQWTEQQCKNSEMQQLQNLVEKVYDSPSQKIALDNNENIGYVEVNFLNTDKHANKEEIDFNLKQKFAQLIPDLQQRGLRLGDIAVLVRTGDEGTRIASMLLSLGYNVMSQGALLLRTSHAVRLCVAALKLVQNSKDTLSLGVLVKEMNVFSDDSQCWEHAFLDKKIAAEQEFLLSLRNQPLVSIFEIILSHFCLNDKTTEFPYIALLHERIIELSQIGAASLTRFIEWWDETGQGLTLSMPESGNAINILTIHKSKGLQFPVVIIPYSDISIFDGKHSNFLWTKINSEPYSNYPLFPVNANKLLKQSTLAEVYLDEQVQTMVDNLNILYVAFTRPQNELYIMFPKSEAATEIKSTADVVIPLINQLDSTDSATSSDESEYSWVSFGTKGSYSAQTESGKRTAWEVESYSIENHLPPIATQLESSEFFKTTTSSVVESIEYGKLMHKLFSLINTSADVDNALYQMCIDGLITRQQADDLKKKLDETLQKAPFSDWYSGKWQIKSERSIINTDGIVCRPDRVMQSGNESIVVDFKFGAPNYKHKKQVENYMNLLLQMDSTCKVSGFVWYVDSNELNEVCQ